MKLFTLSKPELVAIILAIVFGITVTMFLFPEFSVFGTDSVVYALMAQSIAEGNGLTVYGQPHTVFSPLLSIFIAPFYILLGDLEKAAFAENITIGLLSIPLFYLLLKGIHSKRAALIGLAIFTINGHTIFSYLSPSPQQISIFLGIILFILLYRSSFFKNELKLKDKITVAGTGVISSLMYLTRPEYFLLPIPIIIYFLIVYWNQIKAKVLFSIISLFVVGFTVVSLPYILFLHKNLGYWTFTGRSSGAALYLANDYTVGTDETKGDHFISPAAKEGQESLVETILKNPGSMVKRLFKGLRDSERNITRVFGFIGISLFAFGVRQLVLEKRSKEILVSLVIISPILAIALGQGGSTNYLFQFFFVILLFAAIGLSEILDEIKNKFGLREKTAKALTALMVAVSSFYFFIPVPQNYLFTPRENMIKENKMMGLWMKQNLPEVKDQIILSRKPEVSFYAEGIFQIIPKNKSIKELTDFMRSNDIRYLAADERHVTKEYPQLLDLFDFNFDNRALKQLHRIDYLGNEIILFKLSEQFLGPNSI